MSLLPRSRHHLRLKVASAEADSIPAVMVGVSNVEPSHWSAAVVPRTSPRLRSCEEKQMSIQVSFVHINWYGRAKLQIEMSYLFIHHKFTWEFLLISVQIIKTCEIAFFAKWNLNPLKNKICSNSPYQAFCLSSKKIKASLSNPPTQAPLALESQLVQESDSPTP